MALPFVAFVVLLGWGLYDGDIYPTQGAIFAGIWLAFLLGFLFLKVEPLWLVVPTVLLDIVLILKVFGHDIQIR
jgi:hypothetical protein